MTATVYFDKKEKTNKSFCFVVYFDQILPVFSLVSFIKQILNQIARSSIKTITTKDKPQNKI